VATTRVEIDDELLERLRARHPGKDDRALIEDLALVELGFSVLRAAQHRNALGEDQAAELGVRAVHESRRQAG
jgi:hypothetical protein